nr:hypothetical protein 31 [bacterium]
MTATPNNIEWDSAWHEHRMNVAATTEVAQQADREMRRMISTLKAYRLHKKRCSTETEVDFGVLAELILELEMTVQTC